MTKKQPIKTFEDIEKIEWVEAGNTHEIDIRAMAPYEFLDMPDDLRRVVMANLLEWAWETHRRTHWDYYKRAVSQKDFAQKFLKIDHQLFSTYKNRTRSPVGENLDILARYFGPVVYDIMGEARRMPRDKMLYEINDLWEQADPRFRAELLERMRNYIDNKDNEKQNGNNKSNPALAS